MKKCKCVECMCELKTLDETVITLEQLMNLNDSTLVTDIENNGGSGQYPNKTWYSVHLIDNSELQVYV